MLTLEIRPYTIVGPCGGIYARLLPLCLVLSEFGTLGWAADWERRPDSNVQENKDKQEPRKLS